VPIAITVPRVNANEDEYKLVSINVTEGAHVGEGDLLFVIESSKAASEILAPAAGAVTGLVKCALGDFVTVDAPLCQLAADDDAAPAKTGATSAVAVVEATGTAAAKPTLKAKLRAEELGIDIRDVPARGGEIRVSDVEAYHAACSTDARSAPQNPVAAAKVPPRAVAMSGHTKAVIIGGGMHAAVVVDTLSGSGIDIVGCTDRALAEGTAVLGEVRVLGPEDLLAQLFAQGVTTAFIGVCGTTDNKVRRKLFDLARSIGFYLPPAISRSARIAQGVQIGPGTLVASSADIGPHCVIGANVIVNIGAVVCHNCVIEDDVHLTPGSILAGAVTVGRDSTIGMGATVLYGTKIAECCLIHNGASVISNLPALTELGRDGLRRKRS
jgi:sugar O-acyltransferase (sialic acid O-acetyltransferase NeuD family)